MLDRRSPFVYPFVSGGKILEWGNSLGSGTGARSGWRGPFASICASMVDPVTFQSTGSLTNQNGNLAQLGNNWFHEAVGGQTIAQQAERIKGIINATRPDLTIWNGGENDNDGSAFLAFLAAHFAATDTPLVVIGRAPRAQDTSLTPNRAAYMDTNIVAVIRDMKAAVREYATRYPVRFVDPHTWAYDRWTDYAVDASDGVHMVNAGYHQFLAIPLAATIFGAEAFPARNPVKTSFYTSLASTLEVAEGGLVEKIAAGDTFDVTTVYGRTVRIPAAYPVGVKFPSPVLFVHSGNVSGAGAPTISSFAVHSYPAATIH